MALAEVPRIGDYVEYHRPGELPQVGVFIRREGRYGLVHFPKGDRLVFLSHIRRVPSPAEIAREAARIREANGHGVSEDCRA